MLQKPGRMIGKKKGSKVVPIQRKAIQRKPIQRKPMQKNTKPGNRKLLGPRRPHRPKIMRFQLYKGAYEAGLHAYKHVPMEILQNDLDKELNRQWWRWFSAKKVKRISWEGYHRAAKLFAFGFLQREHHHKPNRVLLPTAQKVAAILCVMNEGKTINATLDQLARLALEEIIVVVNGSMDQTIDYVRKHAAKPIVIHYDQALGHDVGRAIGAKAAQSDILLFLDGDITIPAEQVVPFIHAVEHGADVALNNITPYLGNFQLWDSVSVVKKFVNKTHRRDDLGANSLTAVPHALSRKAVETIGYSHLAVPPLAQVIALHSGLKVISSASVNVIRSNKLKSANVGIGNTVERLIVGDHLEALHYSLGRLGNRLYMKDLLRHREYVRGVKI